MTTIVEDGRDDTGTDPDDRLPWLESAEEEYREGPSAGRVIALILGGLLVIALAVYGFNWFRDRSAAPGTGELIVAPGGEYKVKPDEPGGMKVEGEGDTVFATSEGGAPSASVDTNAVPEAPIRGKAAPAGGASRQGTSRVVTAIPGPGGRLTAPTPDIAATRTATSGGGGSLVQLGSFPSEAGANAAWTMLSKRFAYLAPLGKSVEPTEVGGKSYYRLRVNAGSSGQAKTICGRLKVAGEPCFVPN